MKILHTSDWHLGMPAGNGTYEECQRHFFSQMLETIDKEQVGAVLLSGDVFDTSVSNTDALEIYNGITREICLERKIPFFIIAGNHDGAARLATNRELLHASGLHLYGRLEKDVRPELIDGGKVAVWALPFFNRDLIQSFYPEEKITSMEDAMRKVLDEIRKKLDGNRINILMAHALVAGSEIVESDHSAVVGTLNAVSKNLFDGFDYVALGHIHKPQKLSDTIRYSGSPVKYSFGREETQQKGVVLFDTETKKADFIEFSPLYDRRTVKGTEKEILEACKDTKDYLRLYVTDRYRGPELFFEMSEHFPHLLELYGKDYEDNAGTGALTLEELEKLTDGEILGKFFLECFETEPTREQEQLFEKAAESFETEEQLQ